ncbi:MAG: EF-hand domain-containing protein [bacterium]
MKVLTVIGMSVIVAASFSTSVMAEDVAAPVAVKAHKGERQDMFKKADANGDGKLSLEEFKTMAKKDAEKKFTAADTDKDGFLTPAELKAARDERAAHKAAKDAPPPPAPAATAAPAAPAK